MRESPAKRTIFMFAGNGTSYERMMKEVKDSRQERLKLALRENLKRRKSQARGRSEEAAPSSDTADASLDDSVEEEPRR